MDIGLIIDGCPLDGIQQRHSPFDEDNDNQSRVGGNSLWYECVLRGEEDKEDKEKDEGFVLLFLLLLEFYYL